MRSVAKGWTGRAPALNRLEGWFGRFEEHEEVIAMPCKTDAAALHTIGIDTGKNTLHMIGLDKKGAIVLREKVSRSQITARLVNVTPCLIGIEAGTAAHHVARELLALGHEETPPSFAERSCLSSVRLICHRARTCTDREQPMPKIARRKQRTGP